MKGFPVFMMLLLLLFYSCKKESDGPSCTYEVEPGTRFFEFRTNSAGSSFIAWTSKTGVIQQVEQQLALPENQRGMHINGKLARVPEGCTLNGPWSWYFLPDQWALAELSIELCDGSPQYVEENLDEYIRIGGYCPWGSIVAREIEQPF